ncbi:MAG TPA: hypothetical protein VHE08_07265 [Solirubrobacterales bacterium]|nr:hypothetical protein [Solirubrobacterales bacterium]
MSRPILIRISLVLAAMASWFALAASPALAIEEFDRYAVESASASLSSTQAGAHADLTVGFALAQKAGEPYGLTRDIFFSLPAGVIGNPQQLQRCTLVQFGEAPAESRCPVSSQVGVSEVTLGGLNAGTFLEPVYNMAPPGGDVVARFALFAGPYPVLVNIRVDPIDYSLTAAIEGAASVASLIGAQSTFWGVPAARSHDALRLTPLEALEFKTPPGGREAGAPEVPFMTNPTDCATQRRLTVTAVSYQLPGQPKSATTPFPQITGCGLPAFEAQMSLTPTSVEAASATGVDATVKIPQSESPNTLGTSTLKSALVTLPEGLAINPAAGDGLGACSDQQVGYGNAAAPACPDDAKLGTAEIEVPALERTLQGAIYQRTPEPGRLFGFWLVTDEQGVRLKLPAEIQANPLTGQLTTVFDGIPALGGLPQVPFGEFRLHFFGGPRAPLSTPSTCGTYQTHYSFTPWTGRPAAVGDAPMRISSGCGKGGFDPRIAAGTLRAGAGTYAPFTFDLTRADGEANPRTISVHLPEGLLAKLGGVALCPEGAAGSGSCPASSQVGVVKAASGVGPAPLWIPQPGKAPTAVYLAGPYKGAPYSLVSVVPAQAGPFDLGTVVNRAAIAIDPETSEATITTDPLPQILEGVPIAYRAIDVTVDRPEFTLNPTSCEPKTISAGVTASNGATATPSTGFQATDCAKLGFAPRLKVQLKGPTRRTGHPALKAVLTYPKGAQANIARAQVGLPHSLFLDQGNLNKTCTRPVLLAGHCPKSTVYGHAKAWTPLLAEPLRGPVYLVGGFGYKLPALVAELDGKVRILLKGRVDTTRQHGIRNTFEVVPDAPVSRFVLQMKGGKKYSLIENSENLCAKTQRANARFVGQNGAVSQQHPKIAVGCGKGHGKRGKGGGR